MTFSLAGICRKTGQIGCAVATSSVCVGARVGRVGRDCVVLSQARTDPRLHAVGIAAHAAGGDAAAALAAMQAAATAPHWRQLGVLERSGAAAHVTGASCLPSCGGLVGRDCLALGNYLASDAVLPAMVEAFETTAGPLAERLIAGLAAGLAAGGELDPLQSAALLVYGGPDFAYADLRIDKSATPVAELALLWQDWKPKADAYVVRTLDPDSAPPSREVEAAGQR
ncbi:Uncharacterized conserved protein, Ntn-hydrolase superfamily [Tistlia consotensis]|uniref:Uncharacterized conserved protein, Ntn-hydrolase superfamily n=1 Tax=Tistlia consotensis USBA 355 TaxID=560819 RepID=A0A1Y6B7I9_9PROT|nr:DUF1028 domain-containing protein [Tistlia consotensis]SME92673.1 Uncharacterized conserved protein, Ntn-hydrolase superfamily [Tistlia consotensis USBA 355]SNR28177.1 Uncharacterized conserved protein, Ntn-hydrolase superfamily [Tistlia consotensis]